MLESEGNANPIEMHEKTRRNAVPTRIILVGANIVLIARHSGPE